MHQVIIIGGGGAVRILDGRLVAHTVIGVLHSVALVVRGSSQLVQQVHLESGFAQPVFHGDQIAGGVVPITDFLGIIIVDRCYQIKAVVGIFCGIPICIGLGFQVAVAVIGVGGDIAQSIHLLGGQAPAIKLV